MSAQKCPPEALVLLDEALGSITNAPDRANFLFPSGIRLTEGDRSGKYILTWTVTLSRIGDDAEYLEWWDDHWVWLRIPFGGDTQVLWRGRRVGE